MFSSINLRVVVCTGLCLVLVGNQATADQTQDMLDELSKLQSQFNKLDYEVQVKNDKVQFLEEKVKVLNATLVLEQAKTAALDVRVTALEANLSTTIKRFEAEKNSGQATTNLVTSLQAQLQNTQSQLNGTQAQLTQVQASVAQSQTSSASGQHKLELLLNQTIDEQAILAQKSNWKRNETYFSYRQATTNVAQTVIFSGEIAASGQDYNPTTGIFTAPKKGLYWFSATIGAEASDYISCYIIRNDVDYLVEMYATIYTDYSSATASTVVDLKQGDTVYVGKCTGNGQLDAYKTSFSGFLINKIQ